MRGFGSCERRFGSILADGVVPARPYLELERRHFRQRTLECDFWQITRGTCSHVAQDSEFVKRSLDLVERALGKDTPSDIPSLEEVVLVKAIDSVKDWLADPVNCEECGEQFVRKFLEQVVCEECDEEMSVCKECVDSLVMDRAPALP